jgi:hypothetical protein
VIPPNIQRLLEISGPALSESTPRLAGECSALAGGLGPQLLQMLWARNGFYAFEAALHVLPLCDQHGEMSLEEWNASMLWRSAYGTLADGALFFAEDVFGGQFCIVNDAVFRFDPETGDKELLAATVDEWAGVLLAEHETQTGWPLAHEWQQRFGVLRPQTRLVPKLPFVLGGEFTVTNLHSLNSVEAMRFYAEVAVQIRDAPDGAKIQLRVVD